MAAIIRILYVNQLLLIEIVFDEVDLIEKRKLAKLQHVYCCTRGCTRY